MKAVKDPVTGAVTWVDETTEKTFTGIAGYDFDPYDSPGEKAEGMFVGTIIGKFTGEADGFCSTYREWHIFWQGAYAGFRAKTLGDVPTVPPLWQDEGQYYEGAAMLFNVVKCQWPTVVAAIGAIGLGSYTGVIPPGTITNVLHNLMGMI